MYINVNLVTFHTYEQRTAVLLNPNVVDTNSILNYQLKNNISSMGHINGPYPLSGLHMYIAQTNERCVHKNR